jgi:hypothetical protein
MHVISGLCYKVRLAGDKEVTFRAWGHDDQGTARVEFPLGSGKLVPLDDLLAGGVVDYEEFECPEVKNP